MNTLAWAVRGPGSSPQYPTPTHARTPCFPGEEWALSVGTGGEGAQSLTLTEAEECTVPGTARPTDTPNKVTSTPVVHPTA